MGQASPEEGIKGSSVVGLEQKASEDMALPQCDRPLQNMCFIKHPTLMPDTMYFDHEHRYQPELRKHAAVMHWHAIQRSKRPRQDISILDDGPLPRNLGQELLPERALAHTDGANSTSRHRAGNVSDTAEDANLFNMSFVSETASSSNDEDNRPQATAPLKVPMPMIAPAITTGAYQKALLNRHKEHLLWDGEKFDTNAYTPTFVHDIMMLPGSLANLLRKGSSEDIVPKMTPGLLPGYHTHIHSTTLQPCIMQSKKPQAYVQGMLIFGLGKEARRLIHKHYRTSAKRRKVQIEIELTVRIPHDPPWKVQRRAVQAHVWLWSKRRGGEDFYEQHDGKGWTLEQYLLGELGPKQTDMRIEASGKGDEDEDGYLGREIEEVQFDSDDEEEEEREVVYGAPGGLDYERIKDVDFTGW